MYKSIVKYQVGSMYSGETEVYHYNELEDYEIISRAKRILNYKGSTSMYESWRVISTEFSNDGY